MNKLKSALNQMILIVDGTIPSEKIRDLMIEPYIPMINDATREGV